MVHKRRRGTAIVETSKGILVVAWESKLFMLPGGGAKFWESRKRAAMRELYEETRLKAKSAKYLFSYIGPEHKNENGRVQRNHAKVFLIKTEGKAKPSHEVKHIAFWKPGSRIKLMKGAKIALDRYLKEFK